MNEADGVHTSLLLWRTARAVEAHARASVARLGLCGSDFGVIEALLHKGPLPGNELGRKVRLTSGSVTAAVDRLEARGLARRRGDPKDRRVRAGVADVRRASRRHGAGGIESERAGAPGVE